MEKNRDYYLSQLSVGNIVAFKIGENMYSGKVVSIVDQTPMIFTVKTKNGSVYYPRPDDVVWIKNGSYWPSGIYNALKESKKGCKQC